MSPDSKARFAEKQVIEHNDLVTSVAKMDKVPLKMFELAVSYVDPHNPPKDNTIHVSKKDMFAFFDVTSANRSTRFKQKIEQMQKQAFFEVRIVEGKRNRFRYRSIVPIPYVEWNSYNDDVTIRFDQAIMPYLIDLRKSFTQYALTDIMELRSKYSIVLYRWLNMYYRQYEYYRDRGGRTHEQLVALKNPVIALDELRRLTDTVNEYERMSSFTRWVLTKPCEDISAHTHLKVTFEKIKTGRRVTKIRFKVTGRPVARLTKVNREEVQEKQKDARKADSELYADTMRNPYTKLLVGAILAPDDLINQRTMLYLARHVYPLYDEIVQDSGGGVVGKHHLEDHVRYVSRRYVPEQEPQKRNVGRYLEVAADGYLKRLRNGTI